MLGEVALVPKESPINQSGLMFYNTLLMKMHAVMWQQDVDSLRLLKDLWI